MEQITVELHDEMTLGTLRALAAAMGKKLNVGFGVQGAPASAAPVKQPAPAPAKQAAAEVPARKVAGKKKRNISPEARAIFARNLIKARAAKVAAREGTAGDAGLPKAAAKRTRKARQVRGRGRVKAASK